MGVPAPLRDGAGEDPPPALSVTALGHGLDQPAETTTGRFLTLEDSEGGYRAYARPVRLGRVPYVVVTAQSLHAQSETIEELQVTYLAAIAVALSLSWVGGYLIARRSLLPVTAMSRQAAAISAANLHERLAVANPHDELGELATVLNALLARVHDALEQQRRFTADASHELRTPVAVLRSEAEIVLSRQERPAEEYRTAVTVMHQAIARMSTVVSDLFLLARADAGEQPLRLARFYLDELVIESVHTMRSVAANRGIVVRCKTESDLEYRGDEDMVRRAVANLLDNAIKHSTTGARVVVTVARTGAPAGTHAFAGYRITVADTGPGIAPADQPHIFERFYRSNRLRARERGDAGGSYDSNDGAGLGLAIARSIVEAHGGSLRLARSSSAGSEFAITLPLAPRDPAPAVHRDAASCAPRAGRPEV